MHLDGTLFLPVQGRTPRVPVKAAKGSLAERFQASSFMRAKQASKLQKQRLLLSLHSPWLWRNISQMSKFSFETLSPVDKNHLSVSCFQLTLADNVVSLPYLFW